MKNFCSVILLFLTIHSFSQSATGTIKGRVIAEGAALEFASVVLLKTSYSTATTNSGNFILKDIPEGKYQMRISYVGDQNFQQEVIVKTGAVTEIYTELIPLSSKLKEIVVTGNMKEVKKLESVTPIDVYTTKYFQRNPATNIWDALGNVNGIFADVDNGVSNTSDIQINGLEGNYTMILIDGVPAMNGLAGMYALNAFPMSIVDKVEMLRGASSTLYGSDAIAGVINIKTKNPVTAPRFTANVSLNSMLDATTDLSASFRFKKVSALFAASSENADYRWDINGDNFTDVPLVNRANFYNKWSISRKDSGIATIYARYLFEDRFGGQMNMPSGLRGSDSLYGEAITTHQWQAGFQYQLPVKEKVILQADYSEHYQKAWYGANDYTGTQQNFFAQLTWNKKIDKVNDLLLGAAYRLNYYSDNTGLSNDSLTGEDKLSGIGGAFMEDEISISACHKLLLGVRFDYSNRNGPIVTPRINYKWNSKDEKHVVRIGLGTGYRIPNLLNEGFGALNGSRKIFVAEKLKPESALSATANYTRVQPLNAGIMHIDVSVFYTYFFNFIDPDYSQDPTLIVYTNNQNGAMAPGFSINTDFTFNYPLKVGVGCTFTDVFQIDEDDQGNKVRETPVHSVPFMSNFYLSYVFPAPQLSLDWTGSLVSPMPLATVPDDYRASQSPWYTIQNIQLTKKFKQGLEIYLGLKNFFNFVQKDPILRPFDPFNRNISVDNPYNYRFDTTYGFTSTEGIKAFVGLRYTLQ